MRCAGSKSDQNLAFLPHDIKNLYMFFIGHTPGNNAYFGLWDFQILFLASLTIIFMIKK